MEKERKRSAHKLATVVCTVQSCEMTVEPMDQSNQNQNVTQRIDALVFFSFA